MTVNIFFAAVSDYWNLIRPKILVAVLAAMAASGWIAAGKAVPWNALVHALIGTAGLIAGAIALNQRLECASDAKMPRTAGRPLPSGRLTPRQVVGFGSVATLFGLTYLTAFDDVALVVLAFLSWSDYVLIYTPLKKRSIWQTPLGAAAGAMPAVLGAAAVGSPWSGMAWTLFAVVFFWQFPHAMAIAWLYRRQFADAQVRVAPVADPSGKTAGWFAVFGAAALLPASLAPLCFSPPQWSYGVIAGLLGASYLACSLAFFRRPDDVTARRLLRVSLVYLPLLLLALIAAVKF